MLQKVKHLHRVVLFERMSFIRSAKYIPPLITYCVNLKQINLFWHKFDISESTSLSPHHSFSAWQEIVFPLAKRIYHEIERRLTKWFLLLPLPN